MDVASIDVEKVRVELETISREATTTEDDIKDGVLEFIPVVVIELLDRGSELRAVLGCPWPTGFFVNEGFPGDKISDNNFNLSARCAML